MKLSYTSLQKKNLTVIGVLVTVSTVIVYINILSYLTIRDRLTKVTDSNIEMVLAHAQRGHKLSTLLFDINNLQYSFLGKDNFLRTEKVRIRQELNNILRDSSSGKIKKTLSTLLT